MNKLTILLIIPFIISCGAKESTQFAIWITDNEMFNEKLNKDNCRVFDDLSLLGSNEYGRNMKDELVYESGWDWKTKIRYRFNDNVKFNNQKWINAMDKLMFRKELLNIYCVYTSLETQYQAKSIGRGSFRKKHSEIELIASHNLRLNELKSFASRNSSYFDTEVIDFLNKEIDEYLK